MLKQPVGRPLLDDAGRGQMVIERTDHRPVLGGGGVGLLDASVVVSNSAPRDRGKFNSINDVYAYTRNERGRMPPAT